MRRFHVRASIIDVTPGQLHQTLEAFLGKLSFRSRLVGYQMFHEGPGLRLSVETMHEAKPEFTLDARYQGEASGAEAWVAGLCQRLDTAHIPYLLDYVESDANGDEIGEEKSLVHPDFEARYRAR